MEAIINGKAYKSDCQPIMLTLSELNKKFLSTSQRLEFTFLDRVQVKVGQATYISSEPAKVSVVLDRSDHENIRNMLPDCFNYCSFPAFARELSGGILQYQTKIERWMNQPCAAPKNELHVTHRGEKLTRRCCAVCHSDEFNIHDFNFPTFVQCSSCGHEHRVWEHAQDCGDFR